MNAVEDIFLRKSWRSSVSVFCGIESPDRWACLTPEPWEQTGMASKPSTLTNWGAQSPQSVYLRGGFINETILPYVLIEIVF